MFPYRISKNHDRLPVGLNIHGKSHFDTPTRFLLDENTINPDENTIKENVTGIRIDSGMSLVKTSISEIKQTCHHPMSTFEIACLLHKAKHSARHGENSDNEIDKIAANILPRCAYLEDMLESEQMQNLHISQKNTLPFPSRVAFLPHKNDVRVGSMLGFSSQPKRSLPLPLDLLGMAHDINDIGADLSEFETSMSRFCRTVWCSNDEAGKNGDSSTLDIENVSIDIEDRVMLDKLTDLWKNQAGEEAYIKSMQDNKKRKRRNARHSLGQLMELWQHHYLDFFVKSSDLTIALKYVYKMCYIR